MEITFGHRNLGKDQLLRVILKANLEKSLYGKLSFIGALGPVTIKQQSQISSPVNLLYSTSVESYLNNIVACNNMWLDGPEIESIKIISID